MSRTGFDQFHATVLEDPALQARLAHVTDVAAFPAQVVAAGSERGFVCDEAEVTAAMGAARRGWIERWIR